MQDYATVTCFSGVHASPTTSFPKGNSGMWIGGPAAWSGCYPQRMERSTILVPGRLFTQRIGGFRVLWFAGAHRISRAHARARFSSPTYVRLRKVSLRSRHGLMSITSAVLGNNSIDTITYHFHHTPLTTTSSITTTTSLWERGFQIPNISNPLLLSASRSSVVLAEDFTYLPRKHISLTRAISATLLKLFLT